MKRTLIPRILALPVICMGLVGLCYALWIPLTEVFGQHPSGLEALMGVFFSVALGAPGFMGLYLGYQGLRRTDERSVQGVVTFYCIFLFFLGLFLSTYLAHPIPGLGLDEQTQFNIVLLTLTTMATGLYVVASRLLIRFVGLKCPPVRQSLSRIPVAIIALEVWALASEVSWHILQRSTTEAPNGLLLTVAVPIVLGIATYKLGVWLFVEQGSREAHQADGEEF